MVAAAKPWDDDGTPRSVILTIYPDDDESDNEFDGTGSVDDWGAVSPTKSSQGTQSTCGNSFFGHSDDEDSADESEPPSTPMSVSRHSSKASLAPALVPSRWSGELPELSFEVEIDRSGSQELGLDVIQQGDSILYVRGVKPGLAQQFGEANPERKIMPGDRIFAVNGVRGKPAELVQMVRATVGDPVLSLTIRRVEEFSVAIEAPGKLGVDVGFTSMSVKVLKVNPGGLMQEWNSAASPDVEVKVGDHIIEVNGTRGKSETLLKELKDSPRPLRMVLARGVEAPKPEELPNTASATEKPAPRPQGKEAAAPLPIVSRAGARRQENDEEELVPRGHFALQVW